MHGIDLLAPVAFAAVHGRDAVNDRQINRPRGADVRDSAGNTVAGIHRKIGVAAFEARQRQFKQITGGTMQRSAARDRFFAPRLLAIT